MDKDINLDGLEIEPARVRTEDDYSEEIKNESTFDSDDSSKESIREEIKKIEKEIGDITNTASYGDDERLSFLQGKLDNLKNELMKDTMI